MKRKTDVGEEDALTNWRVRVSGGKGGLSEEAGEGV